MRVTSVRRVLGLALMGLGVCTAVAAQEPDPVYVHLGHVAVAFGGTPGGMGLLPTALAEAGIAAEHARLAASDSVYLVGMRQHAGHVMHALDPTIAVGGPGLGYGVRRAAGEAATHVSMAASADSVSENVAVHALHVTTSLANVQQRVDEALALAQRLESATSVSAAAPLARQLDALCRAIVYGLDTDRDGVVGWQGSDGGVRQATYHMTLMMRGEGLAP